VLAEILPEVAVMVVLPILWADVRPLLSIVATDVSAELQVTCVVISWLVPSAYVPVAVNCKETLKVMIGSLGVTDIKTRGTEVTVRFVFPEILPEVAITVVEPAEAAVTKPVALTVATDVSDELQVTCVVISWLVVSEYVPVAVNCWGVPTSMIGLAGVTAMEDRVAEFTVRVVLAEILPEVAVMVVVPIETAMARPVLSTVATDGFDELQVTCVVWLVPSEYVPVAVNRWGTPAGMLGLGGVTARDNRVAEFTVRVVLAEILPEVAVMVVVPTETAMARPVLSTVATDGFDELQVTCVVMSLLVPLEYVPVAVNC
jgi:hypothetical protein